jgi:hypothetical protein
MFGREVHLVVIFASVVAFVIVAHELICIGQLLVNIYVRVRVLLLSLRGQNLSQNHLI